MLPEACLRGTKIEEVTLPVSLRKIGKYVFDKCENLRTITVPENVEQIGPSWFSGSNLVEVIIPKTVKIIGERAFFGCDRLETVIFAENSELRRIKRYAFMLCKQL